MKQAIVSAGLNHRKQLVSQIYDRELSKKILRYSEYKDYKMTEALPRDLRGKSFLPVHYQPSSIDVICARGTKSFHHCGNKSFRKTIADNLDLYGTSSNKRDKSMIVSSIANKFYFNDDERCRFIRFCVIEKLWYEIPYDQVRQKVGQTMRDTLLQQDPQRLSKKKQSRARRASTRRYSSADANRYVPSHSAAPTTGSTPPDENIVHSPLYGHPFCDTVPLSIQVACEGQHPQQNVSILVQEQQLCCEFSLANLEWAASVQKTALEAANGTLVLVNCKLDASDSDSLSVMSCQCFQDCDEMSLSNCDWLDVDHEKLWK